MMKKAASVAVARASHALAFTSLSGSHGAEGSKIYTALRGVGAMGTVFGGVGLGGYLVYLLFG